MNPRTRNALATLVLLLLVAGIVAALVHDNGGKSTSTATGARQTPTSLTVTTPPTTAPTSPGQSVPPTSLDQSSPAAASSTTVASTPGTAARTPNTVASGGAASSTTVAPITRQPRTGGPATLPIGLGLVAAGLLMLRVHRVAARQAGIASPGV